MLCDGSKPEFDLDDAIKKAAKRMEAVSSQRAAVQEAVFGRILAAFRRNRVSEINLKTTSGYGYNDVGRDGLEAIYADVFEAESALCRQQIVSGTHAIALALMSNLLPGDELLYLGTPYDTLHKVIGDLEKTAGSLIELGVKYREIDFDFAEFDLDKIVAAIRPETKILAIQRSKGYNWRPSLFISEIEAIIKKVKQAYPELIVFVDNCYGEFVEEKEPLAVGADLIAGSLIKNPGGGLAPCGGYIAGREDLVERAACRLTAPGIGKEVGPSLGDPRLFYQGLFLAPQIVTEAIASAVFAAALFEELGYEVLPKADDPRTDIIQGIKFKQSERLLAFCRGIQCYSPIDSYVTPMPWDMPGYTDQVVMAAGTFVGGASIELSCDAPIVPPDYDLYFQGGLSRYHGKIAIASTVRDMLEAGLL
jgi:cystathionine beta-lyase family protein involved in aluminum resistance